MLKCISFFLAILLLQQPLYAQISETNISVSQPSIENEVIQSRQFVEPYYTYSTHSFSGMSDAWRAEKIYGKGILVGYTYKHFEFGMGLSESIMTMSYNTDRKYLISFGDVRGTSEVKYLQIPLSFKGELKRFGKSFFYFHGQLIPSWKTSQTGSYSQEVWSWSETKWEEVPTDQEPSMSSFLLFAKYGVGLGRKAFNNFKLSFEIGLTTPIATSDTWSDLTGRGSNDDEFGTTLTSYQFGGTFYF